MAVIEITGISDSRSAAVSGKLIEDRKGQTLIVVPNANRAKDLASDLSFFVSKNIYMMDQEDDTLTFYDAKNRDQMMTRLKAMRAAITDEDCVIIAPAFTSIKKLPPAMVFSKSAVTIKVGDELEPETVVKSLVKMGYERVAMVYGSGQFALRGSILDIFTPYDDDPLRIEFFDIEVDSMRYFDVDTQRSVEKVKWADIFPAIALIDEEDSFDRAKEVFEKRYASIPARKEELIDELDSMDNMQQMEFYMDCFYENPVNIAGYMKNPLLIIDDPVRIQEAMDVRALEYNGDFREFLKGEKVVKEDFENMAGKEDYLRLVNGIDGAVLLMPYARNLEGITDIGSIQDPDIKEVLDFNGRLDVFAREIKRYIKNGFKISLVCSTDERKASIEDFLSREGIAKNVSLRTGELSRGMEFARDRQVIITDRDIFGNRKASRRRVRKSRNAQPIKAFTEIKPGDFVVHENHGVGKFLGIKQLEIAGIKKDYIHIKYAGDDALYVPVENMDMVQKYVGSESITPKIYRLSGTEWKKTKARAKEAIAEMARELIEMSAARKAEPGHMFGPDTVWQKEFEDDFPYEETDDQLRCIEEIKRDMEKPEAMDRLLCGDVGYGKTEVAARAMFKCAAEGKQVAVLVPTTILANQHYNTLKQRFEKFPFKVEMLSRFRSASRQEEIIKELKAGQIDIIIGTHRLLSEDVRFKDLGLLVVDEEQRFGVAHKERIKQLKKNVDVLTLSATPIPRTLHMSLTGIKNMSVIEEPPRERIPVQTYVTEENDHIIREAIEREVGRGGQVFVVFNRVKGIQRLAKKIQELVPDKKIIVGHGQMNETQLEDVMMSFVNGEADVLIATTIIESGIDIPNANTEIIIDADRFGLSQLYQLRGRVGRSTRLAYAYLMYKRGKVLNEAAEKRLRAIKEFTEFGAGFKVAMRDLEIRGAGNILGTQQHGHMIDVGYELYCRLVDEAVAALKGSIIKDEREEITIDIKVPAYIPDVYISDEMTKLNVYKQIASVENQSEAAELKEELEDRFGAAPDEVLNLIQVSVIKSLAELLDIKKIQEREERLIFTYAAKGTKPLVIYKRSGIPVLEDVAEFLSAMGRKVTEM